MKQTCSIIIPTLNRSEIVATLLADLSKQTYAPLEFIVVDQSVREDEALAANASISYIHLQTANTPHARNVGVAAAKGDVVVFFDDDSRVEDHRLVEKIMDFFDEHPFGGIAMTVFDVNAKLNKENQLTAKKIMAVTKTGRVIPNAHGPEQDVQAPRGGGMAFRRKIVVQVGGFDERFRGNAMREETDFSLRVIRAGYRIRYIPELRVIHLGAHTGGSRTENRKNWYEHFFANETLFQLTHAPKVFFPVFLFRKIRPILSCALWYGLARPSWIAAPFRGIRKGMIEYRRGFHPYEFS